MNQKTHLNSRIDHRCRPGTRVARHRWCGLKDTRVTPNHLTTLRLIIGLAGIACIAGQLRLDQLARCWS
jgi:hypothetical protein